MQICQTNIYKLYFESGQILVGHTIDKKWRPIFRKLTVTWCVKEETTESLLTVRSHPYFGKCVTYIHEDFKQSGLYYIRAEYVLETDSEKR